MKKRKSIKTKDTEILVMANAVGAVTVSASSKVPDRELLKKQPKEWPGDPGCRSVMAALDYMDKDVMRVFAENPSSLWVITPYEIIERSEFMAKMKPKEKA